MGGEARPVVRDGTAGPSGGPVGTGRPTRRFGKGCEAYPEGRERSGSPPRGSWWVGRPNRKPGIGQQSIWRSGRGRKCILEVWVALRALSRPSGGPPNQSRTSDPFQTSNWDSVLS